MHSSCVDTNLYNDVYNVASQMVESMMLQSPCAGEDQRATPQTNLPNYFFLIGHDVSFSFQYVNIE